MTPITVGIFVYPGVEDLDFVGPLETFHVAGHRAANRLGQETAVFTVFTVAEQPDALTTSSGMVVQPKHTFADHPAIDVIVLPGGDASGQSTRREVLDWLKTVTQTTRVTASVCTGVYLLAELGLLDGKPATTHWSALDNLAERYPTVSVQRDVRWVEGTVPMVFSTDETADLGIDNSSPVSEDYSPAGSRFNGTVSWVRLDIGTDSHEHLITPEDKLKVAMTRQ